MSDITNNKIETISFTIDGKLQCPKLFEGFDREIKAIKAIRIHLEALGFKANFHEETLPDAQDVISSYNLLLQDTNHQIIWFECLPS